MPRIDYPCNAIFIFVVSDDAYEASCEHVKDMKFSNYSFSYIFHLVDNLWIINKIRRKIGNLRN